MTLLIFLATSIFVIVASGQYYNLEISGVLVDLDIASIMDLTLKNVFLKPLAFMPINWEITMQWLKIFGVAYLFVILLYIGKQTENKRYGVEHGSARWANDKDKKDFKKNFTEPYGKAKTTRGTGSENRILGNSVHFGENTRKTRLNNNDLVIGGSGAGKSRFYVKPNLLQANGNYVVTDPAGELLRSTGKFLEDQGYKIKVFNLVEMQRSLKYNPFHYIREQEDVLKMVKVFFDNTTPPGASKGDPFWEKAEQLFILALCDYLREVAPKEEQTFPKLLELMKLEEIDEDNPDKPSTLSIMFEALHERNPNSIAYENYMAFKTAAGKTLKSIMISARSRLAPFTSSPNLKRIMSGDEIDLGSMATEKTALFIVIPSADSTYNFVVSMMYSQLFETLYYIAETEHGGALLPQPISFYMDEFANIGTIPEFEKKLATMRKYGISAKIILQSLAQLKTMYKDAWETITGNCDTLLYLGGKEQSSREYISKELGKETIVQTTGSRSYSRSNSRTANKGLLGRELMTPDEVGRLDNDKCIILIRGKLPFLDRKYDYPKHPNYKYTEDADDKNAYVLPFKKEKTVLELILSNKEEEVFDNIRKKEELEAPEIKNVWGILNLSEELFIDELESIDSMFDDVQSFEEL